MKIAVGAVVEEGTAQRAKELGRPIYGKTGTTNDYTDAWFIGFDEHTCCRCLMDRIYEKSASTNS